MKKKSKKLDNLSMTNDPKDLRHALQYHGLDTKYPVIYTIIVNLNLRNAKKGGCDFDSIVQAINIILGYRSSKEGMKRIFDYFPDDRNQEIISFSGFKRIVDELGEQINDDELRDMFGKGSSTGQEFTFDEFY
jgi:Ca2+-binding EF-hand superfamily protein